MFPVLILEQPDIRARIMTALLVVHPYTRQRSMLAGLQIVNGLVGHARHFTWPKLVGAGRSTR